MTGFTFPNAWSKSTLAFARAKGDEAFDLFDTYLPLIRYEQQPGLGLAIRKQVLYQRGIIQSAALRVPGPKLDRDDLAELNFPLTRADRVRHRF